MNQESFEILYIEDDAADADFAQHVIGEVQCPPVTLTVIPDAEAAIQRLGIGREEKPASLSKRPSLILLDLNIPRVDGRELLKRIKQTPHLKSIPVVILSTSENYRDVEETYVLGAAGYFSKPSGYEQYKKIFKAICTYWFSTLILPTGNRPPPFSLKLF